MRRWPYWLVISMLASLSFWLLINPPEPEIVVHYKTKTVVDTELLTYAMGAIVQSHNMINELLDDQGRLLIENAECNVYLKECENQSELPPDISELLCTINKATSNVEIERPKLIEVLQSKASPKHALTISGGMGPDGVEIKATGTKITVTQRIRPVLGLGYMYFVTDDVGIGVMGYSNKTAGITFTYRF